MNTMRTWIPRGLSAKWLPGKRKRQLSVLQTAEQFHHKLDVERMRTDRTGGLFSLVNMDFDDVPELDGAVAKVDRILESRLRATDSAGRLSPSRVAIILPETPEPGAWRVIEDVLHVYGSHSVKVRCQVHVYGPANSDEGFGRQPSGTNNNRPVEPAASAAEVHFIRPMSMWKRGLDVFGSGLLLIVLTPLLLLISGLILLTSGRPVFFLQQRAGAGNRPFRMYKFRTMCRDAEARQAALRAFSEQDGPAFKMQNDPRITRLGRFLRKSTLDELPQLWNVLRGEMTLVGPRPLPLHESDQCTGWQRRRLHVVPGLTCIWQVDGKSRVSFDEWMRMDLRYIKTQTLWQDLKLIARTAAAMVLQKASH